MKHCSHTQQGMTFPGFVVAVFLAVFFLTLLFKIGPVYMENSTINSAMNSVKEQQDLTSYSRDGIVDLLNKQLAINNVSVLTPQNIAVTKHGDYVKIQITYDHLVPLFSNLDVVAHFDDVVEVGSETTD